MHVLRTSDRSALALLEDVAAALAILIASLCDFKRKVSQSEKHNYSTSKQTKRAIKHRKVSQTSV